MRALLIVAALGATASAETVTGDSWLELGAMRARIAMADGHAVDGYAASGSVRVPIHHHFYAGGEFDRGNVAGTITTPATFRATGLPIGNTTGVEGSYTALRLLVGARARTGMLSAGGELVGGFHREEFHDLLGEELGVVQATSTQLEARVRIDVWVTPKLSLGAVVGADDGRDMTAGLVLGVHFAAYDEGSPDDGYFRMR